METRKRRRLPWIALTWGHGPGRSQAPLRPGGGIPEVLFGSGGRPRLPQQGEKYGKQEVLQYPAPKAPGGGARL